MNKNRIEPLNLIHFSISIYSLCRLFRYNRFLSDHIGNIFAQMFPEKHMIATRADYFYFSRTQSIISISAVNYNTRIKGAEHCAQKISLLQ